MFPTIMLRESKVDLNKRTPFGPLWLANQMHACFLRSMVGFECITLDAGAHDVFPRGWSAAIARNDVVQIEILAVAGLAAILAGVLIALENIVPRKLDLLFRDMIVYQEEDYPGNAQPQRDGSDRFRVGFLSGKVLPFCEIESLKRAVVPVKDGLSMALKEQSQGPASGADINRLPKPIKHQHVLAKNGTHLPIQTRGKLHKRFCDVNEGTDFRREKP